MTTATPERIRVLAFTDPYCSWCWATEPELLSLREKYGDRLDIQFVMGGLVEDMSQFYDASNDIGTAAAVVPHWAMVSERSGQPIDENLWVDLEAYPHFSTWPANIAAEAAFLQGPEVGERYLRRLRRAALTERRIISDEEEYLALAREVDGLDFERFGAALADGSARAAFERDRAVCAAYGVHGFPTMLFGWPATEDDPDAPQHTAYLVNGHRSMEVYERALHLIDPTISKHPARGIVEMIGDYGPLTRQELVELTEQPPEEVDGELARLVQSGTLRVITYKQGREALWGLASGQRPTSAPD